MGDIADDMINGLACSDCGVYFVEEHGYPVLCNACYQANLKNWIKSGQSKKSFREEFQPATFKQIT